MNGQSNGVSSNGVESVENQVDGSQVTNGTQQSQSQAGTQVQNAGQQRIVTTAAGFTQEQLQSLRLQIQAFKMLSMNVPLPAVLQDKVFPRNKGAMPAVASHSTISLLDPTTTLRVTDFSEGARARDLAHELCDIPVRRAVYDKLYALAESESRRDADDAYREMHNRRVGADSILKVEWAEHPGGPPNLGNGLKRRREPEDEMERNAMDRVSSATDQIGVPKVDNGVQARISSINPAPPSRHQAGLLFGCKIIPLTLSQDRSKGGRKHLLQAVAGRCQISTAVHLRNISSPSADKDHSSALQDRGGIAESISQVVVTPTNRIFPAPNVDKNPSLEKTFKSPFGNNLNFDWTSRSSATSGVHPLFQDMNLPRSVGAIDRMDGMVIRQQGTIQRSTPQKSEQPENIPPFKDNNSMLQGLTLTKISPKYCPNNFPNRTWPQ